LQDHGYIRAVFRDFEFRTTSLMFKICFDEEDFIEEFLDWLRLLTETGGVIRVQLPGEYQFQESLWIFQN